jgi:ribokinase
MGKKILCMGSINIDLTMFMRHLPVPGETIVTDNFSTYPGGKGGNQSAAAAQLGAAVSFLTKLGDDDFSRELLQKQKDCGVNVDGVMILKGETAGIAMIRVDETGQNSISFTPGANKLLSPQDILENEVLFEESDILLVTMEINTATVYQAIKTAKEHGLTVVLDPAPAPLQGIPENIAQKVDYVKPNESEAETLTGIHINDTETAKQAFLALRNHGFSHPILTLGKGGLMAEIAGKIQFIKPYDVKTVDSTAAGDIFLGAFTAALADGKTYLECLQFANVAAALSTTKKGAQSSIPLLREVTESLGRVS